MAPRTSELHLESLRQCHRGNGDETKRVIQALEELAQNGGNTDDPIVEQLKQCPEAFKVGEILGKAFDSLKYSQNEDGPRERYLPPSGAVIPPLV